MNETTHTTPPAAPLAGHTPQWYAKQNTRGQGLIIDEADGRTVAVAYDGPRDAETLAAAPALLAERDALRVEAAELRRLLRFLADAADTEPGMRIYREHIKQARAALARTGTPEGGRE